MIKGNQIFRHTPSNQMMSFVNRCFSICLQGVEQRMLLIIPWCTCCFTVFEFGRNSCYNLSGEDPAVNNSQHLVLLQAMNLGEESHDHNFRFHFHPGTGHPSSAKEERDIQWNSCINICNYHHFVCQQTGGRRRRSEMKFQLNVQWILDEGSLLSFAFSLSLLESFESQMSQDQTRKKESEFSALLLSSENNLESCLSFPFWWFLITTWSLNR